MIKSEVINKFGNQNKLANFLGLTQPAIAKWGDIIPENRARQLAMAMPGVFKFDESLYKKKSTSNHKKPTTKSNK